MPDTNQGPLPVRSLFDPLTITDTVLGSQPLVTVTQVKNGQLIVKGSQVQNASGAFLHTTACIIDQNQMLPAVTPAMTVNNDTAHTFESTWNSIDLGLNQIVRVTTIEDGTIIRSEVIDVVENPRSQTYSKDAAPCWPVLLLGRVLCDRLREMNARTVGAWATNPGASHHKPDIQITKPAKEEDPLVKTGNQVFAEAKVAKTKTHVYGVLVKTDNAFKPDPTVEPLYSQSCHLASATTVAKMTFDLTAAFSSGKKCLLRVIDLRGETVRERKCTIP